MAILKIARMGHPVLHRAADPVDDPAAPEIRRLIADMIDTVVDAGGAGLAAPQVHVPLRVVIFRLPDAGNGEGEGEDKGGRPMSVLINPEITPLGDDMVEGWEGCLSLPGMLGAVPRHRRIRYSGADANGAVRTVEAEDFHARVVQHECDHLDGILYPMRMTDLGRFGFVEEMRRRMADASRRSDTPQAQEA